METLDEGKNHDEITITKHQRSPSQRKTMYNTKDFMITVLTSTRHLTNVREAAEITAAAWIDDGIITEEDSHMLIDHKKLRRT